MKKIPKLLVGPPGVGKTATVLQSYDHVEVLLLSSSVEEDIYGLPYREGEHERRTVPPFLSRLREADAAGKTTCLFLDEIDKGRKEVVDTLLTLVASGRTPYGFTLPAATDIIAAANPPEFGGGDGISIPMLNRLSIQEFVVHPAKWKTWAYAKFSSPQARKLIDMLATGDIPLLDSAGEGLGLRITSPRSVAYGLAVLEQYFSGQISSDEAAETIGGLLTPSVSAHFIALLTPEVEHVLQPALDVVRRWAKVTGKRDIYLGRKQNVG